MSVQANTKDRDTVWITALVDRQMKKAIERNALLNDRSASAVIRIAIRQYLEREGAAA